MDNVFRVSIAGRCFDVPTQEISPTTLTALKAITDANNNSINARDLLCAFLESLEEKNVLENAIIQANQKLPSIQNTDTNI